MQKGCQFQFLRELRLSKEGTGGVSDVATEKEGGGGNKRKKITNLSGFENTVAFLTIDFLQGFSLTLTMLRE